MKVRLVLSFVAIIVAAFVLAACGASQASGPSLSGDAKAGQVIAEGRCMGCHTSNGQDRTGPTFSHLAKSQVKLTNGQVVTADDAYLTESITLPDAKTVSGYAPGVMSSAVTAGTFSPDQVRQLVAYIDALN